MNNLELLSPAGDIEIFKAVVNAGADAVYFGGNLFGARAYAKNFTIEEAAEAINYAHLHGARAYLTVNTLLKNTEIERNLYNYLKQYVISGIDAFIVQDFGVFSFIKEYFPDTHIHVSTQASLCTRYGAKLFKDLGATRIVTAREISIDEIKDIHVACPDLEIESFVHGALCVCYSGQCLMSSIIGGRSGNRGRCAQPCRLPYEAYDIQGQKLNNKGAYILSPKDFCTIAHLPQMIEAGVISFKIEGRMKQLDYAAGVVNIYRHYLDKYISEGANNYKISKADMQKLLDLGNRSGFTDLYLHQHNGAEMITFKAPSHTKIDSTAIDISERKKSVDCQIVAKLNRPFSIMFSDSLGNKASIEAETIQAAMSKPTTKDDIIKAASAVGNTIFELSNIEIDCDDDIFVPVSTIKKARREALGVLADLIKIPESAKTVLDFDELKFKGNSKTTNNCFVTISTDEQLQAVVKYDFIYAIAVPVKLFDKAVDSFSRDIYIYLPAVLRKEYYYQIVIDKRAAGVIVASYDELGFLIDLGYDTSKIILDYRMYTFNNRSINAFRTLGIKGNCVPYELSFKELGHRDNRDSQFIVYSKIPMMVTANCTVKNTKGCKKALNNITLVDRKNQKMTVFCNCDYCYNIIYNSKRYIAFDLKDTIANLGFNSLRLDFSVESYQETIEILQEFNNVFYKDRALSITEEYTRGHLKRGVE